MKVSVARRRHARLCRAARLDAVRRDRRSRDALWRALRLYTPTYRVACDRRLRAKALGLMLEAWSEI